MLPNEMSTQDKLGLYSAYVGLAIDKIAIFSALSSKYCFF